MEQGGNDATLHTVKSPSLPSSTRNIARVYYGSAIPISADAPTQLLSVQSHVDLLLHTTYEIGAHQFSSGPCNLNKLINK